MNKLNVILKWIIIFVIYLFFLLKLNPFIFFCLNISCYFIKSIEFIWFFNWFLLLMLGIPLEVKLILLFKIEIIYPDWIIYLWMWVFVLIKCKNAFFFQGHLVYFGQSHFHFRSLFLNKYFTIKNFFYFHFFCFISILFQRFPWLKIKLITLFSIGWVFQKIKLIYQYIDLIKFFYNLLLHLVFSKLMLFFYFKIIVIFFCDFFIFYLFYWVERYLHIIDLIILI